MVQAAEFSEVTCEVYICNRSLVWYAKWIGVLGHVHRPGLRCVNRSALRVYGLQGIKSIIPVYFTPLFHTNSIITAEKSIESFIFLLVYLTRNRSGLFLGVFFCLYNNIIFTRLELMFVCV